jgi:hypothetical protein
MNDIGAKRVYGCWLAGSCYLKVRRHFDLLLLIGEAAAVGLSVLFSAPDARSFFRSQVPCTVSVMDLLFFPRGMQGCVVRSQDDL